MTRYIVVLFAVNILLGVLFFFKGGRIGVAPKILLYIAGLSLGLGVAFPFLLGYLDFYQIVMIFIVLISAVAFKIASQSQTSLSDDLPSLSYTPVQQSAAAEKDTEASAVIEDSRQEKAVEVGEAIELAEEVEEAEEELWQEEIAAAGEVVPVVEEVVTEEVVTEEVVTEEAITEEVVTEEFVAEEIIVTEEYADAIVIEEEPVAEVFLEEESAEEIVTEEVHMEEAVTEGLVAEIVLAEETVEEAITEEVVTEEFVAEEIIVTEEYADVIVIEEVVEEIIQEIAIAEVAFDDDVLTAGEAIGEAATAAFELSETVFTDNSINSFVDKGFVAKLQGQYEPAIQLFIEAVKLHPPVDLVQLLMLDISSMHIEMGNYRQAWICMENLLQDYEDYIKPELRKDIFTQMKYLEILQDLMRKYNLSPLPLAEIPDIIRFTAEEKTRRWKEEVF